MTSTVVASIVDPSPCSVPSYLRWGNAMTCFATEMKQQALAPEMPLDLRQAGDPWGCAAKGGM